MYFIDMYKLYNLIHKYNITLNVAVKEDRVTGKFNYYTGFKTLKVPVINTKDSSVSEFTFNQICVALKQGKKIYPLEYKNNRIVRMDINDVDIACDYVLKKGIFYKDYFVFMTEENDGLCVVIGGKLYIYPIRLINDITDIHLEDNRIYLKTKEWVSAFITELDLDINEDIAIKDNFFCNISNYREKSAKEINNIISAKKALVEGLKGFNKK